MALCGKEGEIRKVRKITNFNRRVPSKVPQTCPYGSMSSPTYVLLCLYPQPSHFHDIASSWLLVSYLVCTISFHLQLVYLVLTLILLLDDYFFYAKYYYLQRLIKFKSNFLNLSHLIKNPDKKIFSLLLWENII